MPRVQSYIEQLLRDRQKQSPTDVWLKFQSETFTWNDVIALSQAAANGLLDLGARPGERIGIMAGNKPEFLWLYFGALMIGAQVVPLNEWQRGAALEHMLSDAEVSTLAIDGRLEGIIASVRSSCPKLQRLIILDGAGTAPENVSFHALLRCGDGEPRVEVTTPSNAAALIYTSGTTGKPKGIVADLYEPLFGPPLMDVTGVSPGETIYTFLPLFHANALMLSCIGSIRLKARLALAERFSASQFWNDCRRFEAVEANLLGSIAPILLRQPESKSDKKHLVRTMLSVGCPAGAWREFESRFGVRLIEFYGMSDAPGNTVNLEGRVGSAGLPLQGAEFRIVDEADREVPRGTLGEIIFRHPAGRATNYHNLPDLTAHSYRGGWFHSGDLGEMDEDGYLYFRGRAKEAIRRRGENISAWEIESTVNLHPSVKESAAVGVPSELGEEEVMVTLVAQPGATIVPEDILTFCKSRLAYFAVPRFIEVVDELPKTATQKIQHGVLKVRGVTERTWDRERAGFTVEKV
jgi:crotonobetaine/carnitine-CoA ligase